MKLENAEYNIAPDRYQEDISELVKGTGCVRRHMAQPINQPPSLGTAKEFKRHHLNNNGILYLFEELTIPYYSEVVPEELDLTSEEILLRKNNVAFVRCTLPSGMDGILHLETVDTSRMVQTDDEDGPVILALFTLQNIGITQGHYARIGIELNRQMEINNTKLSINYPVNGSNSRRFDKVTIYPENERAFVELARKFDVHIRNGITQENDWSLFARISAGSEDVPEVQTYDNETYEEESLTPGSALIWSGSIPFVQSPFYGDTSVVLIENNRLRLLSSRAIEWDIVLNSNIPYHVDENETYDGTNVEWAFRQALIAFDATIAHWKIDWPNAIFF